MDLATAEAKLLEGAYASEAEFYADISKIIRNSYLFNWSNE